MQTSSQAWGIVTVCEQWERLCKNEIGRWEFGKFWWQSGQRVLKNSCINFCFAMCQFWCFSLTNVGFWQHQCCFLMLCFGIFMFWFFAEPKPHSLLRSKCWKTEHCTKSLLSTCPKTKNTSTVTSEKHFKARKMLRRVNDSPASVHEFEMHFIGDAGTWQFLQLKHQKMSWKTQQKISDQQAAPWQICCAITKISLCIQCSEPVFHFWICWRCQNKWCVDCQFKLLIQLPHLFAWPVVPNKKCPLLSVMSLSALDFLFPVCWPDQAMPLFSCGSRSKPLLEKVFVCRCWGASFSSQTFWEQVKEMVGAGNAASMIFHSKWKCNGICLCTPHWWQMSKLFIGQFFQKHTAC